MSQKFKKIWCCLLLGVLSVVLPLKAQVLPLEQKNMISGDWMVLDQDSRQLMPYAASVHADYNAVHQWVSIVPSQPFKIRFTAKRDLCLFLNNQLLFIADSTSDYTIDLSGYSKEIEGVNGKYLLTAWHPSQQPLISTYRNQLIEQKSNEQVRHSLLPIRVRDYMNQNAFILCLLLIGLIYGGLRASFVSDFRQLFDASAFIRTRSSETSSLAKPISSWSSILFVLAFSLTMALLIAAIHTNVQHVQLFNRLFPVSDADIITKILFYTIIVFLFILLKYLFLKVMGFIFGLEQVVQVQYSEFVRTILFLGIFLPVVMLLYLALNISMPGTVLLVSNLAVFLLLIITALRVFIAVNKKAAVLNLHLFSYLCATEVIPLAIMLKLIVFSF